MAKNTGKQFEEQFQTASEKTMGVYCYRLRDSASSFAGGKTSYSVGNDYDYFLYKYPYFYPVELKSNKGTSFSYQRDKSDKGKDIKCTQINGLLKASKVNGVNAGFIFNFSTPNRTYWVDIKDFYVFYCNTDKKSINEKDILSINGILIEQTLKIKKYDFNIEKLIRDINKKEEFMWLK